MNKNYMLASALALVAALTAAVNFTGIGERLTDAIGMAAWYLPYAAVVGAAHFYRMAKPRCRSHVA